MAVVLPKSHPIDHRLPRLAPSGPGAARCDPRARSAAAVLGEERIELAFAADEARRRPPGFADVLSLFEPRGETFRARHRRRRLRSSSSPANTQPRHAKYTASSGTGDERGGVGSIRQRRFPIRPEAPQVMAPGLLKAGEEQVRAAEEEDRRQRRVALGQRREILVDHGFEEARHDLPDRHAATSPACSRPRRRRSRTSS